LITKLFKAKLGDFGVS